MASAADVLAVATPSWRAKGWRSANDLGGAVGVLFALVLVLLLKERAI